MGRHRDLPRGADTTKDGLNPNKPKTTDLSGIAVGSEFACGLVKGAVKCWGKGEKGQLGGGVDSLEPLTVKGIISVSVLGAGGSHVCALKESVKKIYCWGANNTNQVDGSTEKSYAKPQVVSSLSNVVGLVVGTNFSCARLTDQSVWCWGKDDGFRGDPLTVGQQVSAPTKLLPAP